ncbi:EAL domain-containing protein [Nitriliruptoraceae bacterium ZYF776]|nr:EAL domain-containing protein [Profundirhabdus halotolerans]
MAQRPRLPLDLALDYGPPPYGRTPATSDLRAPDRRPLDRTRHRPSGPVRTAVAARWGVGRSVMGAARARRGGRCLWALVAVALVAAHQATQDPILAQALYVTVTGGAAAATALAARRWPGRSRRAWGLVAAGMALSALGDLTYGVLMVHAAPAVGGVAATPLWLAGPVFMALGIWGLGSGDRSRAPGRRVDGDLALDVAMISSLIVFLAWGFTEHILTSPEVTAAIRRIWIMHTLLGGALLVATVRLALVRTRSLAPWLVIGGVLFTVASNYAFGFMTVAGTFDPRVSIGWQLGFVLLAAAAHGRPAPVTRPLGERRVGPWRLAVAQSPIVVPAVLAVALPPRALGLSPTGLVVATVVLATLVGIRGLRFLRSEEELRRALSISDRFHRELAANAADASVVVDGFGRVLSTAPALRDLLDLREPPAPGVEFAELTGPVAREAVVALLARAVNAAGEVVETEFQLTEGTAPRWLAARATDLRDEPAVGGIVVNLQDVTPRKQVERQLERLALHDELTGLANRAVLRDRLEHALERAARTVNRPTVLYLDVDRFKTVNDSLGHDVGDALLVEVAAVLQRCVRSGDTVARMGGDEFALLLEDAESPRQHAQELACRIRDAFVQPLRAGSRDLLVTVSIGIAVSRWDSTVTSLLRDADTAMYVAKNAGRNRAVVHEPAMLEAASERLQLELDLLAAPQRDELSLRFQPVVDLRTQQVTGFEALLRWHHPVRGDVSPDRFIPVAELTGAILPIGRWVLRAALEEVAVWRRLSEAASTLKVGVNVSARQLVAPGFVDDVAAALEDAGVPTDALVLEITESLLVEDVAATSEVLHALHRRGVTIAIDDFGTGYSSLTYLRQFPIDILKIDRSFVTTIGDDGTLPPIVQGVLDLAATLGLASVAEGVELEVQEQALRQAGCGSGQGWLFSRPLVAGDAPQLVRELTPAVARR